MRLLAPTRFRPRSALRPLALAAGLSGLLAAGPAAAQNPPACPFKPDALKAVFGIAFDAGTPEPAMGTGCVYKSVGGSKQKDTDIWVGIYINDAQPEAMRTMMLAAGKKHELVPVAGDPDKAIWVRHRGDVPPFSQVAYIRGGKDVMLNLRGVDDEADEKKRLARIDGFNAKLLKLPRVP